MKIVIEDDRSLRMLQVVLDPAADPVRRAAFADYIRHDITLEEACRRLSRVAPSLFPATVVTARDPAELRAVLPGADVLISESLCAGAPELDVATNLRAIVRFGVATDGIDTDGCRSRGIAVITQRRRTNVAVAEHAMAMTMALAKQLPRINGLVTAARIARDHGPLEPYDTAHTPNANWARIPGLLLLSDMTLGILGMGEIGREMARLGNGIGMRVLYHQRTRRPAAEDVRDRIEYRTLDGLLEESDVVSVHLPMNDSTRNLLDKTRLKQMKAGAILINTARAAIVDKEALIEALDAGQLGGAGLDVLHDEPTAETDPLLDRDNVILTPHLAGGSRLNRFRDFEEIFVRLEAALRR